MILNTKNFLVIIFYLVASRRPNTWGPLPYIGQERGLAMSILPVFILVCLVIHLAHATTTCKSLGTTPNPSAAAAFAGTKFDYLVVGGGTAGLVIAERCTINSRQPENCH